MPSLSYLSPGMGAHTFIPSTLKAEETEASL